MNWLTRNFGSIGSGGRNPADDRWWTPGVIIGRQTTAVTADTVIQIPEVHACLSVLAQDVAQLPFFVFAAGSDGSRERLSGHPVTRLLGEQANIAQETTAFELRAQMTFDAAFHRNAYAEIVARRGRVELVRLDPLAVEVRVRQDTGEWLYEVQDGATRRRLLPEEVLHLRMPPLDSSNLRGRSMLVDGYRTFSRMLAIEDYLYRFYENDATPGGVIEYDKTFKTQEDRATMRDRWQRMFTGRNRNKVAILDDGAKFKEVPVKNTDAQLIETYRAGALQVCRLWRMQPHKIGILDNATFTNIEQQALEHVIDTLMPLLVMWEQAIKRALLADPRHYAHHNVAGLLRGDLKSRYESYAQARNWGWLSVNDIRRLENLNPIEGGDIYLQPLNMVPAGTDVVELQRGRNQRPGQQPGALLVALENVLSRRLLLPPSGE